jgi:hypothetical protein
MYIALLNHLLVLPVFSFPDVGSKHRAPNGDHFNDRKRLPAITPARSPFCLVGTTGFEPAASPTPRVRATRLRHVPSRLFQYGLKECFVKRAWSWQQPDQRRLPRVDLISASPSASRSRISRSC